MMNSQTKLNIAFSIARVFAIFSIAAAHVNYSDTTINTVLSTWGGGWSPCIFDFGGVFLSFGEV